jgi:orotate phosphoribosyltransferase
VDRQQGGQEALAERGYQLHAVFTLRELLQALRRHDAIPEQTFAEVSAYLDGTAA